jgi:hypothetical protein
VHGHVHGLGIDPADNRFYVASHEALYTAGEDGTAVRVGDGRDDFMGFTVAKAKTLLATGHPAHGTDGPARPRRHLGSRPAPAFVLQPGNAPLGIAGLAAVHPQRCHSGELGDVLAPPPLGRPQHNPCAKRHDGRNIPRTPQLPQFSRLEDAVQPPDVAVLLAVGLPAEFGPVAVAVELADDALVERYAQPPRDLLPRASWYSSGPTTPRMR